MIGFQTDKQKHLFYSFDLENHIPQNHLLRSIGRFLDLSDLRQHLAEFYSHTKTPGEPEAARKAFLALSSHYANKPKT